MRLKLKHGGATCVVDVAEPITLLDLCKVASSNFSLDASRVTLHAGFPPFPCLSSSADVRGGMVIDVRVLPPMTRHSVPADNSCLFTCICWLLSLPITTPLELRHVVSDAVLADTTVWNDAVLGRAPREYATHICSATTWGGGIELAILARLHKIELAAIEIRSGTMYVFGEGESYKRRAYLIFDGMHYDALARGVERIFLPTDLTASDAVVAFAAHARASHEFTDLTGFSLRCVDCSMGLIGETAALQHARETGHGNFAEFAKKDVK